MEANDSPPVSQIDNLLPVLVHIQSHLASDLSLEKMAQLADFSPFHFHRLFQETIGETLKQYTQRLRLERGAYALKIQDVPVVDVAFGLGFNHHETFSRAFKRWFGVSPRQYRHSYGRSLQQPVQAQAHLLNKMTETYQLSPVTVQKLKPLPVAFKRNLGSYLNVETDLFDQLIAWADQKGVYDGENLLLGVGHDDPNITPTDKVRFDVCLSVPDTFTAEGDVGFQTLPGGHFAAASYVGPFGPTLMQAYGQFFQQMRQLKRH